MHRSNPRWQADLAICVKHKVPLIITSLGTVADLVDAVHAYGGLVFYDVINARHSKKAAAAGVDGLIAVCNGARGHAGITNPFALVAEIRQFFDKTVILAEGLSHGPDMAAAEMMGADMAYMHTRFFATTEANIADDYQDMIICSTAIDVLYTPRISGMNASFIRQNIADAGINPKDLTPKSELDFGSELDVDDKLNTNDKKAWRDIWSAGQSVDSIDKVISTAELVDKLVSEYHAAIAGHQKNMPVHLLNLITDLTISKFIKETPQMQYKTIDYQVSELNLTLSLNRPEHMNSFTVGMANELVHAFNRASDDDDVTVIVVTGNGRAFCAGMDLTREGNVFGLDESKKPTVADMQNNETIPGVSDTGGTVNLSIYDCKKTVIAAINGVAIGVGATMLAAMDIRLVSEKAKKVLYLKNSESRLKHVQVGFYPECRHKPSFRVGINR